MNTWPNRAELDRTMAASFARKPSLFSEVLSTVLGRFISVINNQYTENMRYSHPRWGRPNWFSWKHFSIKNSVLTIDSEKFPPIVADFRLQQQVFDSWDNLYNTTWNTHLFEPHHDKTNKMACAPSEDSDQPWHPPSLISLHCLHDESLDP